MKNKVFVLILCALDLLTLASLKEAQNPNFANGKSCKSLQFEYDSVVCVCNSTYCDFVPEIGPLEEQEFHVYESNKAGKRFDFSVRKSTSEKTDDSIELFINLTQRRQKILGFGGAFTDAAGINIKRLSDATQEALLQTYFSASGSRYNLGRVPIGGSDFSERPYTYDDIGNSETDMYLDKFALQKEDYEYKIPFMKRALEINPDLKFSGAVWSPPPWMKTNGKISGIGEF